MTRYKKPYRIEAYEVDEVFCSCTQVGATLWADDLDTATTLAHTLEEEHPAANVNVFHRFKDGRRTITREAYRSTPESRAK